MDQEFDTVDDTPPAKLYFVEKTKQQRYEYLGTLWPKFKFAKYEKLAGFFDIAATFA